jgi:hypothetical protein
VSVVSTSVPCVPAVPEQSPSPYRVAMSQKTLELVRQALDACESRDFDRMLSVQYAMQVNDRKQRKLSHGRRAAS